MGGPSTCGHILLLLLMAAGDIVNWPYQWPAAAGALGWPRAPIWLGGGGQQGLPWWTT